MAMSEDDIQTGWIYRTSNLQERLVLGRDRDQRVVYVSKGKNPDAPFQNCHVRITGRRFAERAIGKVRFVDDVRPYVIANKATTVVVRERVARTAPPARPASRTALPDPGHASTHREADAATMPGMSRASTDVLSG